MDRLIKSAHFLPIKISDSLNKLAELYIKKIIKLHEILVSIVSDSDMRFTSQFWSSLQEVLGTRLKFNTAFYPQVDGQSVSHPFLYHKGQCNIKLLIYSKPLYIII